MIGKTLGHYRILEQLGAGGMGVVYRAHDERLDRDVAVKVLPPGSFTDDAARKRFRKEALALSKLNQPNIATVHDFDSQEGVDFLVMEFVDGETLAHRIEGGPLAEKEIATLGAQIADALEEAHENGVIHRDLKPSNIMVTPKGRAKVLDFGLAKLLRPAAQRDLTASLTATPAAAGTLPYMAPEQLQGEQAEARSDIYALGAVLYEMATGQRPFREELSSRLIDSILHHPPVSPRALNARITPELERIVLKCLEKSPDARYQSALEVGVDLRRIGAPSGTPTAIPVVPKSRRRRIAVAVAAAVVIAAIVLFALNIGGLRERFSHSPTSGRISSLAVLPLANLSHDPEQDYFADGMTEALITDLAQISALKVISRTSVMKYKGTTKNLPEIGRELNVDGVIEGSVQRSGDRVKITAQLIQAPTDRHVWARSYERDLRDILALQDEVAQAIADEIRVTLTPNEQARLASAHKVSPEAHEAYLKGLYYFNIGRDNLGSKLGTESIHKSIESYKQANTLDPSYALAYAGLARAYHWQASVEGDPLWASSKEAAIKALQLDDGLAEAHGALGYVLFAGDQDWAGAEKELKRAIELNPGYGETHHGYALLLHARGRFEEAIREINRAMELDPLTIPQRENAAWIYLGAGQFDRAIELARSALDLYPNSAWAHSFLAVAYIKKAMIDQGLAEIRKAFEAGQGDPDVESELSGPTASRSKRMKWPGFSRS